MTAAEMTAARTPWRVLVTGFLDWPADRETAAHFDRFRCMENPSGRLLIGHWHEGRGRPAADGGELPRLLSAITTTGGGRQIRWLFETLPVCWDIAREIDTTHVDAVVNIGLGVYDTDDLLLVEQDAVNLRSMQCDAADRVPGESDALDRVIDPACGAVIEAVPAIRERVAGAAGVVTGTRYRIALATARGDNAYVCNDTHATMLGRVRENARPRRAFFIHIPTPPTQDGYDELARALASVIPRLVEP